MEFIIYSFLRLPTCFPVAGMTFSSYIVPPQSFAPNNIAIVAGLKRETGIMVVIGGGTGCKVPWENNKYFRLTAHSLVFFGFIVALISISFYPNIFGYIGIVYFLGSLAISIGTVALIYIHITEDRGSRSQKQSSLDYAFTVLLFFAGITGVLIPILIGTDWFNWNFLIHDALMAVVFLIAPFSKFIHPVFRLISLIKYRSDS